MCVQKFVFNIVMVSPKKTPFADLSLSNASLRREDLGLFVLPKELGELALYVFVRSSAPNKHIQASSELFVELLFRPVDYRRELA